MTTITVGSDEHKRMLHRYSAIRTKFAERGFITLDEFREFGELIIQLNKLTRIDAAPSPLRRAVDADFSGEER